MFTRTKNDMEDIIKNVHLLRSIHASDALRQSIAASSKDLPKVQNSWYMPFAIVQAGVVAFSILLFVVLGSGVVAADQLSQKGHPLYGVRQTIEQLPVPFVHRKVTPTPTTLPNPTIPSKPTAAPTLEKSHGQETRKNENFGDTIHKAVKAAFDFRGYHQFIKTNMTRINTNHTQRKEEK